LLLPENIVDQLVLWEHEVNRIKPESVYFFDMFDDMQRLGSGMHSFDANRSTDPYKKLFGYVVHNKLCIWHDKGRFAFAVTAEKLEMVQQYAQRLGFE
jgi:hypothetical protein